MNAQMQEKNISKKCGSKGKKKGKERKRGGVRCSSSPKMDSSSISSAILIQGANSEVRA